MRRALMRVIAVATAGLALAWLLTRPSSVDPRLFTGARAPDLANGETLFFAGGCGSCHESEGQDDVRLLGGGHRLASSFGTFVVPNISPDRETGIGGWSEVDFANAMLKGVGRHGEHLYPAFPYTAYQRMTPDDVRDLYAYLMALPPVAAPNAPHQLGFPFNIRRLIGGWKFLYLDGEPFTPDPSRPASWNRGAYLTEALGHCAECHSPRNGFGAIDPTRRYAGGPDPTGKGYVPNITPHKDGIAGWSAADIEELLTSGFTPDYDSVGSTMTAVVRNTARLSEADRAAIAEYIASLPPLPGRANAAP